MICARRLSPRDRGPGEDAAITCMEGISVPHRESREQRESSSAGLHAARWGMGACVLPAWGVCMGVGHKDLGPRTTLHVGMRRHVALFRMVPRRWSRSNIVSRRLRLQTGRKTRISAQIFRFVISGIFVRLRLFVLSIFSRT